MAETALIAEFETLREVRVFSLTTIINYTEKISLLSKFEIDINFT